MIVLEAVLWMAFTPCPSGWLDGIKLAKRNYSTSNTNFIVNCINGMVMKEGCVSAGSKRRRQPSHQRTAPTLAIMKSLHNLLPLISLANNSNNTSKLLKAFAKPVSMGGLYLTGELMATEIIHVLTKIGIIQNRVHIRNVSICKGTNTYSRLALLGIKSDEDIYQLMTYLCTDYDLSSDVVENSTCEALRWYHSTRQQFHETIGGWQKIYTFDKKDMLIAYDVEGNPATFAMAKWDFLPPSTSIFYGVCWWKNDYATIYEQQLEGDILLTNN